MIASSMHDEEKKSVELTFTLLKPVITSAANCSVLESDVAVHHSPKRVGSGSPYNLCLFLKSPFPLQNCYLLLAAINLSPDSGTSKSGAVVTSLFPPSLWPQPKRPPPLAWDPWRWSTTYPLFLPPHFDSLRSPCFFSLVFASHVSARDPLLFWHADIYIFLFYFVILLSNKPLFRKG